MKLITSLNEAELEETFDRSSGPGGQNVNKTSTKVTLRHLPTGLAVTVQDTRSQAKNRALARDRLLQALQDRARRAAQARQQEIEKTRRQKRQRPKRLKQRILEAKRTHASVKRERARRDFDGE